MRWHGSRLRLTVTPESVQAVVEVGDPVTITVRGVGLEVGTQEVSVPLDGQGPRRNGGPHAADRLGAGATL